MIQIKDINLGLAVANGVEWTLNYKTGVQTTAVVLLLSDSAPINNWDGAKIGVNIGIPDEIMSQWGADDSVIDNYILQQIGAEKL